MKTTMVINNEPIEFTFMCHASLAYFGGLELEVEDIVSLDTGASIDFEDILTPEIEGKLIEYFDSNYDPTPYE